jgi:TM2 domain-containing membrane protein YozV
MLLPTKKNRSPRIASVLSLLVPGLGQMYAGRSDRGAAILVAGIIIGTLALIWQTLYTPYASNLMMYPYPFYRLTLVVYAAVFWIWQVADAYRLTK